MKKIIGFLSLACAFSIISCNNATDEQANKDKAKEDRVKEERREAPKVDKKKDLVIEVPLPPPPPPPGKIVIKTPPLPPLPPPPPLPPKPKRKG